MVKPLIKSILIICFLSPLSIRAQQFDVEELIKKYSNAFENTEDIMAFTNLNISTNSVTIFGIQVDKVQAEALVLLKSLQNDFIKLTDLDYPALTSWEKMASIPNEISHGQYEKILTRQKQEVTSRLENSSSTYLIVTDLSQAQSGADANGHLTLGNYLSVLSLKNDSPMVSIGVLSSKTEWLGNFAFLFDNNDWVLIDSRPLRNHAVAGNIKGDYRLFLSLLLRFDYLLISNQ